MLVDSLDIVGIKMSEKIKLLAEQAGQGEPFHIPPEFIEKFANLIVQECIRECKQELYEFTAEDRSYDDLKATAIRAGYRNGVFKVISRIKQHFGVEE